MSNGILIQSIALAIASGTAVLLAASGELLAEKVGVYNFGIDGIMLISALGAFAAAVTTSSWVLGLLAGMAVGAIASSIYAVAVVLLRADSVMAGIAVWFLAIGLTGILGDSYVLKVVPSAVPVISIPVLSDIPFVGPALFEQSVIVYIGFLIPLGISLAWKHTRHGLNMRAIGEDPDSSDVVGLPVTKWRFGYLCAGGLLMGLGGGFLSVAVVETWSSGLTAGQGWIAFALVFFAGWRPMLLIVGAYLFGGLLVLGNVGQAEGWAISPQIFSALPYVATVAVLCGRAWVLKLRGGGTEWPAGLGKPFYRRG